jgi:hypothetical protein
VGGIARLFDVAPVTDIDRAVRACTFDDAGRFYDGERESRANPRAYDADARRQPHAL